MFFALIALPSDSEMGQSCLKEFSDDAKPSKQKSTKYESHKVVALEHTDHPHAKMCEPSLIAKKFREFGPICTPQEALLCIAAADSCTDGSKQLLAAGEDRSITLLNYETGHILQRWRKAHDRDVMCLTRPIVSGHFASGGRDKLIKIWSIQSPNPISSMEGHSLHISSVTFDESGRFLISGSRDNTVRLWDVERAEALSVHDIKLNVVHFVRWLDPLRCVAQGGEDLTIRLWDLRVAPNAATATLDLGATISNFDYHPICADAILTNEDPNVLLTGHNGCNGEGSMITTVQGSKVGLFRVVMTVR